MNRGNSLRRDRRTTLGLRLLKICLALRTVGLLVNLLAAGVTRHIVGITGLAVGTFLLEILVLSLAVTLEAQSVHIHGHGIHPHDLPTRNLSHFQPQFLTGVQSRSVQHHVPAQRFLLQPINVDASFHKIGDGEASLFFEAPNVTFPRLDVVLCISLESTVQDAQQHTGEATPGLRLPLLLKTMLPGPRLRQLLALCPVHGSSSRVPACNRVGH